MGVKVRQKLKGKGEPWWVFIVHNGRRTSRRIGSKEAAEIVQRKIEARLELGEFDFEEGKKEEKPEPTFKEYADSGVSPGRSNQLLDIGPVFLFFDFSLTFRSITP
jgi:hypothetical protein